MDDSNASLPSFNQIPPDKLETLSISAYEVEDILKTLKTGKAAGPDSIDNRLLKELARPLSAPLTDLFNFSLSTGKVPSLWKQANVTPVFKKNDPSDVSNYRPISLLNTIGKVLEKIIHKYIYNFLKEHQVITTLQSGFIPGDSTVNQLVGLNLFICIFYNNTETVINVTVHTNGIRKKPKGLYEFVSLQQSLWRINGS